MAKLQHICRLCGLIGWGLFITVFWRSESPLAGPTWLLGRGETPSVLACVASGCFATLLTATCCMRSRAAAMVSLLAIPMWLLLGCLLRQLADW